jgi:GT2 family glycosyltransferase
MDTIAPPVVAVIVTCDPGEWFAEVLRAFGSQTYPELSVLVLDAGSEHDPTPVVASILPGAFVRRLGVNRGFGASADEVLSMVEGASLLLLCHDDVAPDPDAVHVMVEESFRSNAGIVAPKLVSWDDPTRLLHVGMAVDKGGAVVDRVQPGEIDHGQHDAVRDVFLAPGGCTLVRADLFAELGGFDPAIVAMGEDLDLCWRAQIFGARVVVAPGARVRHLELLAGGGRALPNGAPAPDGETDAAVVSAGVAAVEPAAAAGQMALVRRTARRGAHRRAPRVSLQAMQRRHELYAALKAYTPFHLARVLPQVTFLAVAEIVVATASGDRDRASAVAHAWRWNLSRRRALRAARAAVQARRRLDDATVRRLQLRGSARLNAYFRRVFTRGLRTENFGDAEVDEAATPDDAAAAEGAVVAMRARARGGVTAEGGVVAEAGAVAQGSGVAAGGVVAPSGTEHVPRGRADDAPGPARSTRRLIWLMAALVVVFGTRQLLGTGMPILGQFLPFPSWAILVHRFASAWQPTGVGTTDPTSPATGMLGLAGMLLFGSMGLLEKIVVLGCIPVGAIGMARLTRPLGTAWARVTSTLIYLAIPVPYDALATGRWDGLVVYAACPWIVYMLGCASRVEPLDGPGPASVRPWRHSVVGWSLALGLLDALVTSLAPSAALITLLVALGLALGHIAAGRSGGLQPAARVVLTSLGASAVMVVLLAPWSLAVLGGPGRLQVLAGVPVSPSTAAGWGSLLRLAAGPIGDAALAWAFLAAAALPLVIGTRWRLAWGYRAWSMAVVAWVFAWLGGRGWLGPIDIVPQVMLVPAGVGIALAVGLGVSAFQLDLPGYRFGWRQAAAVTAAAAAVVGMLPVLVGSLGGRWDLVSTGYGQATSWMAANQVDGASRVVWIGDPRVLPGSGWELAPGLAYAVTEGGVPDVTALWQGSSPGAAGAVGDAIGLARRDATVRLGRLLAPYAVRYVVVVDSIAPAIAGFQTPLTYQPPADVIPALTAQVDLRQVISQGGFEVFVNSGALPVTGVRAAGHAAPAGASAVTGGPADLNGWRAALSAGPESTSFTGRVGPGAVLAAVGPGTGFVMTERDGSVVHATGAFGYAATFTVPRATTVTVSYAASPAHALEITLEIVLWVVALAAIAGRRRWLDWWWGPLLKRRRHRGLSRPAPMPSSTTIPTAVDPDGVNGVAAVRPLVSVPDDAATDAP